MTGQSRQATSRSCSKAAMLAAAMAAVAAALVLAGCSSSMGSTSAGSSSMDGSMEASTSGGTGTSASSTGYTTIDAAEAKQMIDGGGVTVVDVREQNEYDAGHIAGAVLVPMGTIGSVQPEALPDLDATIIVYCRTGVRSAQASSKLADIGYTHIYNMDGGITSWSYGTVTEE